MSDFFRYGLNGELGGLYLEKVIKKSSIRLPNTAWKIFIVL